MATLIDQIENNSHQLSVRCIADPFSLVRVVTTSTLFFKFQFEVEKSRNVSMDTKRDSIKSHTIILNQITASKPKSVFLDGKPTLDRRQFKFGKTNRIGIKEQGLQSIRRAAFAIETNDEVSICIHSIVCHVIDPHYFFFFILLSVIGTTFCRIRILCIRVRCPFIAFYVFLEYFRIHEMSPATLNLFYSHGAWAIPFSYLFCLWFGQMLRVDTK